MYVEDCIKSRREGGVCDEAFSGVREGSRDLEVFYVEYRCMYECPNDMF